MKTKVERDSLPFTFKMFKLVLVKKTLKFFPNRSVLKGIVCTQRIRFYYNIFIIIL